MPLTWSYCIVLDLSWQQLPSSVQKISSNKLSSFFFSPVHFSCINSNGFKGTNSSPFHICSLSLLSCLRPVRSCPQNVPWSADFQPDSALAVPISSCVCNRVIIWITLLQQHTPSGSTLMRGRKKRESASNDSSLHYQTHTAHKSMRSVNALRNTSCVNQSWCTFNTHPRAYEQTAVCGIFIFIDNLSLRWKINGNTLFVDILLMSVSLSLCVDFGERCAPKAKQLLVV